MLLFNQVLNNTVEDQKIYFIGFSQYPFSIFRSIAQCFKYFSDLAQTKVDLFRNFFYGNSRLWYILAIRFNLQLLTPRFFSCVLDMRCTLVLGEPTLNKLLGLPEFELIHNQNIS